MLIKRNHGMEENTAVPRSAPRTRLWDYINCHADHLHTSVDVTDRNWKSFLLLIATDNDENRDDDEND